jgi:hypothetical protein
VCNGSYEVEIELELEGKIVKILVFAEDVFLSLADVVLSRTASEDLGYKMRRYRIEIIEAEELSPELVFGIIETKGSRDLHRMVEKLSIAREVSDLNETVKVETVKFTWDENNIPLQIKVAYPKYNGHQESYLKERSDELEEAGIYVKGHSNFGSSWHG